MYSYEDRIRAVKLYIKYDLSAADTIRELGYPSRNMLVRWYKEYLEQGDLHEQFKKGYKYTLDEMKIAVDHYLEHGCCLSRTVRILGYPSRPTLAQWIEELAPGKRKISITRGNVVQFSAEQRKDAVISLCTRETSAALVAEEYGTSRCSLYKWKKQLLSAEDEVTMDKFSKPILPENKDELLAEMNILKRQVYKLQLEVDMLNKAAEIIKKEQGIDLQRMTNKEKALLIDALRGKYTLNELLSVVGMAKSSYFYQRGVLSQADKHHSLRGKIIELFNENRCCYGYRRLHASLKNEGITVSEKTIRMLMKEENLIVQEKKKRKYSSYLGEISPDVCSTLKLPLIPIEKYPTLKYTSMYHCIDT